MEYKIEPIAVIHNEFKSKFGIPRQSGLDEDTISTIVFEKKYRDENALRGLSQYSHIWLLWIFSENEVNKEWSPTVRPPRLGGNKRMGVFSTRSPYHPNNIGLSCVKIESIEKIQGLGSVIKVSGADILDGTPIIDIKPYLTLSDCKPDAVCGFSDEVKDKKLDVIIEEKFSAEIPEETLSAIISMLSQDPRPSYHDDKSRIYAMNYSDYEIKFTVNGDTLTVISIFKTNGCE